MRSSSSQPVPKVLLPLLFACVLGATGARAQDAGSLNSISGINVRGATVEIVGTKKPNFTTFTLTDPPRLVIDISEAVFSGVKEELPVGNGTITAIRTASYGSDESSIARVLIGYEREVETDIQARGSSLVVSVAGSAPVAAAATPPEAAEPAPAPTATGTQPSANDDALKQAAQAAKAAQAEREQQEAAAAQAAKAAQAEREQQEAAVARAAEQQKAEDEARKQAQARAETERKAQEDSARVAAQQAEQQRLQQERATQAADKKRQQDEAQAAAEARRDAERQATETRKRQAAEERARRESEAQAALEARREQQREARVAQAEPARRPAVRESGGEGGSRRNTMTLVGFKQERGASRVFVRTTEPVRYSVTPGDKRVVLELENTVVSEENNTRSMDTSFFDTAVVSVDARQGPSRTVRVSILLKQQVAYEARQEGNELSIEFQRPARR